MSYRFAVSPFLLLLFTLLAGPADARQSIYQVGWDHREPYHYFEERGPSIFLTGIDIETLQQVADLEKLDFGYSEQTWAESLAGLKSGDVDVLLGAFRDPVRESYAWFSNPYRTERQVLFSPLDNTVGPIHSVDEFKQRIEEGTLSVGIVDGFFYGEALTAFLYNPEYEESVIRVNNEDLLVGGLLKGQFDVFVADRLVGIQSVLAHDAADRVAEPGLILFEADVHVMFSKKSVAREDVERFNRGLESLRDSGELEVTLRHFIEPIAFSMAIAGDWFFVLDVIGTIAFAISGVLIARRENYSLLGAFVLASLPAVGGGVVRDLLIGRDPIGVLQTPLYLILVAGTVLIGFAVNWILKWVRGRFLIVFDISMWIVSMSRYFLPRNVFELFDAMGLAAFTVTGVAIASRYAVEPLWL